MMRREAARLARMTSEVRTRLDASLSTGRYTPGFLAELAARFAARGYNLHEVFDEIAILEGTSPRRSRTPPATERPGPPPGLWQKHHQPVLFPDPAPRAGVPGPGIPNPGVIVFARLPDGSNAYLALGPPQDPADPPPPG